MNVNSVLSDLAFNPQDSSPLFTTLPAEIRFQIFSLSVNEGEDLVKRYPRNALWNRPGYYGPRTIYTDLLRTCKRAYHETWFLPWKNTSLTFYLAGWDRRPAGVVNPFILEDRLKALDSPVEFEQLRIFAQLYILEPGRALQDYLELPNFAPKSVTLTIRHTDCWQWETDEKLHIDAKWVRHCRFPNSVREIVVKIETLERKRPQAEAIAAQAAASWIFRRTDEANLRWAATGAERWTGSSILNHSRWIRDESRPGQLDYYIAIITFKLDGSHDLTDEAYAGIQSLEVPPELDTSADMIEFGSAQLSLADLKAAGVPIDAPAGKAVRMVTRFRRRQAGIDSDGESADEDDSDWESASDANSDGEGDGTENTEHAPSGDEAARVQQEDVGDGANTQADEGAVFVIGEQQPYSWDNTTQAPATREEDELNRDEIVDGDRDLILTFLPGCPRPPKRGILMRFDVRTGYEYQWWKNRYYEWRRRAKAEGMDDEAATDLRHDMLPFWMPARYCDWLGEVP